MTRPSVPIYLNARNLLQPLREMVDYLTRVPRALPIIVDNDSTWEPLLEWYEWECPCRVIHTRINGGPQACFRPGVMLDHANLGLPFYVVTDPDLDLSNVPLDVLDVLEDGLHCYPERMKCGLSLEVSDIPDAHPFAADVRAWEAKFWMERTPSDRFFCADIDTTFAMRRSYQPPAIATGHSLRTDRPYTAKHVPWYWTRENMTDEVRYYLEHATAAGIMWSARMRSLGHDWK